MQLVGNFMLSGGKMNKSVHYMDQLGLLLQKLLVVTDLNDHCCKAAFSLLL